MAKVTGLSGNEIYCLALKNFAVGELVIGNSVNSMGFLGSLGAGFSNILGGEIPKAARTLLSAWSKKPIRIMPKVWWVSPATSGL